eukprot:TRINITY_DN1511_c0_g2_i3.p1 TRINITY_DN1511_c0_g2~~TRINITY_DN1511_c0_g2_i3.p1  ORF type:complete len:477 (+),score=110.65 TRINITY_DN1511_c0_g2_i3:100-1530(+)
MNDQNNGSGINISMPALSHPNAMPIENRFTRIAQEYRSRGNNAAPMVVSMPDGASPYALQSNSNHNQFLPTLDSPTKSQAEDKSLMNGPVLMTTNSFVEPSKNSEVRIVQPSHVNQEHASGAMVCNPLCQKEQNSACCRLCGKKEKMKNVESGISTLIYPCKCIQPIHRKCLDNWRSVKKGQSFIKCNGCGCSYRLVVKEGVNLTAKKVKFGFFFARDTFLFLLLIQLLIIGCAFAIERIDSCSSEEGCGTNCKPHCGEEGAPGGKLLNLFFIGKWEMGYKATYYLMGLCLFLAIVGVIGSWIWVVRKCRSEIKKDGDKSKSSSTVENEADTCCLMCYFGGNSAAMNHSTSGGHSHHYHGSTTYSAGNHTGGGSGGDLNSSGRDSNDCCDCDCDCGNMDCNCLTDCNCDCDGEGAIPLVAIALVVAVAILVLFIVLGVVFGFIGVTVVATYYSLIGLALLDSNSSTKNLSCQFRIL